MGYSRTIQTKPAYNSIAFRILVVILWSQYTVMSCIRAVIARLPIINFLSELFIPMSIILVAMACLPWFLKRVRGVDLLFYLGMVLVVLFSMIFHPMTVEYLEEEWWRILIAAVPMYFVGVSFSLKDSHKDLFWCSIFSILAMFLYKLYELSSGRVLEADDMDASYRLLPSALYLFYYAFNNRKAVYYAVAAGLSMVLLIFGTRGPILCVLVFVALSLLYSVSRVKSTRKIVILAFLMLAIVFVASSEALLLRYSSVFAGIFERIGFSTRIFEFMLSGDIVEVGGRQYLARQAVDAIIKNPIEGYGMTGDRAMFGVYVHNLFLEMWCQYGVIIGSIFIFAIIALTATAGIKTFRYKRRFLFVLMLASMIFVKLMVSSTYTIEPYFFFMLGFYVNINRKFSFFKKG